MTRFRRAPRPLAPAVAALLVGAAVPTGWIRAQDDTTPRTPDAMPLPAAVAVQRGDREIRIDGSLQDWPDLVPLRLDDVRQLSGTADGAWKGPQDLAARFFLLWDEDALYFGGQVLDDWHTPLAKERPRGIDVPPADAVVLTFDPERDTASLGPGGGRVEDRGFWIGEVPDDDEHRLVQWDRLRGTVSYAEGGEARVRRLEDAKRTDVEVRIPWSAILPPGREPRVGMIFDLQVHVEDHDEPTDPIAQTRLGWTFGMGTRIDPGAFGAVMLLESIGPDRKVPVIPASEAGVPSPDADPQQWIDFLRDLRNTRPVVFDKDAVDAPLVGGETRLKLLRRLETSLRNMPRIDVCQLAHRVSRRMTREAAGIAEEGLPFFWHHTLEDVSRRAMDAPSGGASFRLFRLPEGGWMVRSKWGNFGIDPRGYDVEDLLWGGMDFVLLSLPIDETRRNDRLLVRMQRTDPPRPVYTHLKFHLPSISAEEMATVRPGVPYETGPFKVLPHAPVEDGMTTSTCAYTVLFPDGARLVVGAPALAEEHVREQVDLLLLDPNHPRVRVVGQRMRARLTVIDQALQPQGAAQWGPRVTLEEVFALQRGLLPNASLLLAPGEYVDVIAPK